MSYTRNCQKAWDCIQAFFDKNFSETQGRFYEKLSENHKTKKYEIYRTLNFRSWFKVKLISPIFAYFTPKMTLFRLILANFYGKQSFFTSFIAKLSKILWNWMIFSKLRNFFENSKIFFQKLSLKNKKLQNTKFIGI